MKTSTHALLFALLGVLLFGGCASTAPPSPHLTARMSEARTTYRQAQELNANTHAPRAFQSAERKLAEAQEALAKGKHDRAERLATQAQVDAELALLTARSRQAKSVVDELQASIETLREEMARKRSN